MKPNYILVIQQDRLSLHPQTPVRVCDASACMALPKGLQWLSFCNPPNHFPSTTAPHQFALIPHMQLPRLMLG